jgi:hypothetical protein
VVDAPTHFKLRGWWKEDATLALHHRQMLGANSITSGHSAAGLPALRPLVMEFRGRSATGAGGKTRAPYDVSVTSPDARCLTHRAMLNFNTRPYD